MATSIITLTNSSVSWECEGCCVFLRPLKPNPQLADALCKIDQSYENIHILLANYTKNISNYESYIGNITIQW